MRKGLLVKRLCSVFMVLVMMFTVSIPGMAVGNDNTLKANRLINSGFESGGDGWSLGWNWSISSEAAHSGTYSLKCAGVGGWSNTSQIIAVTANATVTLTFWGKSTASTVYKVVGTASGTNITGDRYTNNNNQWTQYTVTFTNGSDDYVTVLMADGGGTHYFDDFSVTNGDAQADIAQNQVKNSGLESASSNWSLGGNWSISTAQKYSGTYSLKCDGTGGWSNSYQQVAVVANSTYKLTFYGRSTASTIYKIIGVNTGTNLTGDRWTNATGRWTRYTVTINSGNNTSLEIYFGDGGGVHYFDDISLEGPSPGFVVRSSDRLMLDGSEFRFVGANSFYLHDNDYIDDYTSQYTINDIFKTCKEMGITVVRFFPNFAGSARSLKPSLSTYNTASFEQLDYIIKTADEYDIKLIIPLCDNYTTRATFTGWRGVAESQFYTNATVVSDFKAYIQTIINRVNSYTGVAYKDDPAILCWETGNELSPPYSWTSDIAAYIKSIDTKHLVMDGKYGVDSNALTNNNIDIVSSHFYGNGNYVTDLQYWRNFTRGYKPFIGGEFGDNTSNRNTQYDNLLSEAVSNGTAGIMVWGIFGHRDDGGFQQHNDGYTLHYPGDNATMVTTMDILRNHAYEIQGLSVPAKSVPLAAQIVRSVSAPYGMYIQYKGSAGAVNYTVERAASSGGPWTVLASAEAETAYEYIGYLDAAATVGTTYYYRIKAQNSGGSSAYSNVFSAQRSTVSNFVSNPGFENGSTGWTLGWNWSVSSVQKHSGSYSLNLNGSTSWSVTTQTVNVAQNTDYILSFYGKSTAQTVYKVLGTSTGANLTGDLLTNASNQWTRYDVRFNSGNHTTIDILIADGGGTHYFDDFSLFTN